MIKILNPKPIQKHEIEKAAKTKEEILSSLPVKFQKTIEEIINYLLKEGVKGIYLFGSLYEGDYNDDSDIDLAVEYIDPKIYYKVAGSLALDFDIKCDLIDLKDDVSIVRFLKRYERWVKIG